MSSKGGAGFHQVWGESDVKSVFYIVEYHDNARIPPLFFT